MKGRQVTGVSLHWLFHFLICWYAPTEPRDTCTLICLILASGAARHLPAHLPDTRQRIRVTPACSSAWYSPAEPRDNCLLICLILTSWAPRHLPAHLPDTRQLIRVTPACSSAWYSPAEPRDTFQLICLIFASWAARTATYKQLLSRIWFCDPPGL